MALKSKSTAHKSSGSNSQDKAPGGKSGEGGGKGKADDEEEEEEEEEESDDSDNSDAEDSDAKVGKEKGVAKSAKGKDEPDLSTLPEATQNYIQSLRRECGKHRTRANNLQTSLDSLTDRVKKLGGDEEEELEPEERVRRASSANEQLALDNALLETAVEFEIPKAAIKYFKFLVAEKMSALEEGEELSDEDLEELADQAKATSGSGKRAKTSVSAEDGDEGAGGGKNPSKKTKLTVQQFAKMTTADKTALYRKDQAQYTALMAEAKEKRLFY